MILTLTPNPSVDRTIALAGPLARGEVQRVLSATAQGGGKGVNISRAAVAAGLPSVAVLPASADDPYVHELLGAGIDCRTVAPAGEIRVNLTLTEPDGTTTKLNSPGAQVTPTVLDDLRRAVLMRAEAADWVVLAGSLPPGAPARWYADLVRALRDSPARVAVDTSDEPLAALVAALPGSAPHLMKPNGSELASLTGASAAAIEADPSAAAAAAEMLLHQGVETVLVTLGGAGAVLVTGAGAWHAAAPPIEVVSTVGAGDSALFGYLLGDARGAASEDRLALAVAYGSAAAGLPGTTIPHPDQVRPDLVEVTSLRRQATPLP